MKKIILSVWTVLIMMTALDAQIRYDVEPQGAGLQIHPEAEILYSTCGNRLQAFDISNPEKPVQVSTVELKNFPQSLTLDVENGILYVADSVAVTEIDVSKPEQLKVTDTVHKIPGSPVDVLIQKNKLWIAGRRAGLWEKKGNTPAVKSPLWQGKGPDWVRSVSPLKNGGLAVCGLDCVQLSVVREVGKSPEHILIANIPVGTPRRVREGVTDGTYYVANGFCGYGKIVLADTVNKTINGKNLPWQQKEWTENLNRFSTYGSYVYDVMELKPDVLLLAAGEIGIVTVINGKLSNDCPDLNWGNINGFIRGKGNLLYVADLNYGLLVVNIADPRNIKVLERIKMIK